MRGNLTFYQFILNSVIDFANYLSKIKNMEEQLNDSEILDNLVKEKIASSAISSKLLASK